MVPFRFFELCERAQYGRQGCDDGGGSDEEDGDGDEGGGGDGDECKGGKKR